MALALLTTLVFSIFGILLLFLLKSWEMRTGQMLAEPIRPTMSKFFHSVLFWVERVIPVLAREYAERALRTSLGFVHRTVALLVLLTERTLQHILQLIHRSTDVKLHARGEASAFLREVAEHKHKLLRAQRGHVRFRKE